MSSRNWLRRTTTTCVALGLLLVTTTAPASAHNQLIGSSPSANAELAEGPPEVRLDFDQPVDAQLAEVTITGPDGSRWETGKPAVRDSSVTGSVSPLGPAGKYVIGYRIMSADGHPVSGSISFTLLTAGPGAPSAPTGPVATQVAVVSAPSGADTMPIWPWLAGAAVLLALGVLVARRVAS